MFCDLLFFRLHNVKEMNTLGTTRSGKITASQAGIVDENMAITFVKDNDRRMQAPLIDPGELNYNPSTKTWHADNFSGGMPSLVEGEAIKLTTINNRTAIDVNFTKSTEVITTVAADDTLLISNTANELKIIRGDKLKEDVRLTVGSNLSYSTIHPNSLGLNASILSTALSTGCTWNGNFIPSNLLSNGTFDLSSS